MTETEMAKISRATKDYLEALSLRQLLRAGGKLDDVRPLMLKRLEELGYEQ